MLIIVIYPISVFFFLFYTAVLTRGGVEDTRLEAATKSKKKIRGQIQG